MCFRIASEKKKKKLFHIASDLGMCDSNRIAHRGCIARFGPLSPRLKSWTFAGKSFWHPGVRVRNVRRKFGPNVLFVFMLFFIPDYSLPGDAILMLEAM